MQSAITTKKNVFTVTRTTAVLASEVPPPERTDLNMTKQRRQAYVDRRDSLQSSLVATYNTTICSRARHHEFLACMLNEVQRYHQRTFGVDLPREALENLAAKIALDMRKNLDDPYAECLQRFAQKRLYSTEFHATALQMAAHKSLRSDTSDYSNSSSSSNNLSSGSDRSLSE